MNVIKLINHHARYVQCIVIIALCLVGFNANAQGLSATAKAIFKECNCKLTDEQKNGIARLSGFVLQKDQTFLHDNFVFDEVKAWCADLNGDGVEEVFLNSGSFEYYGNTASGFSLFMANSANTFKRLMHLETGIPSLLNTQTRGYTDLMIGGPGFKHPVWVWNGSAYSNSGRFIDENKTTNQTKNNTALPEKPTTTDEVLSPQAIMLFKGVKSRLSNTQKNQFVQLTGYTTNDPVEEKTLLGKTKTITMPLPVDLNHDGKEELFVAIRTTTIGLTSVTYHYYTLDSNGKLKPSPGLLGVSARAVKSSETSAYPVIIANGENGQRNVWKWSGNAFLKTSTISASDAIKYPTISIESLSESYTSGL
jgi:hypothetical protein